MNLLKHIWKNFLMKIRNNDDEVLKTLSLDTQIILSQYMEKVDHYGKEVYVVKDIKRFDTLIQKHFEKKFCQTSYYKLQQCIKEELENGSGFLISMNGKQYVAISPPELVKTDSLVE